MNNVVFRGYKNGWFVRDEKLVSLLQNTLQWAFLLVAVGKVTMVSGKLSVLRTVVETVREEYAKLNVL
ncbi:hypothetical protein [Bacillus sp. AK031]